MQNNLFSLYQSTVALHERFSTSQTVQQSLEMFTEEYTEVLDALNSRNVKQDISDEFVDCLVTAIGVFIAVQRSMVMNITTNDNLENLQALFFLIKHIYDVYLIFKKQGISLDTLDQSIVKVIEKNNAKTLETHEINSVTGKITRKVLQ